MNRFTKVDCEATEDTIVDQMDGPKEASYVRGGNIGDEIADPCVSFENSSVM